MDFTAITIDFLKFLSQITGSYGMAIVFLTILVRVAMWPLGASQQRSMKKMQELSPKLKQIQERYKSDPQVMQKKMMEFYKEHNFNPFGGCFPLLIQMPVFIMLYAALVSPQFIELAGKTSFLFINRLDAPIRSHAGVVGDKVFGVEKGDTFSSGNYVTVYTDKGVIKDVKVNNPRGIFLDKKNKQDIIPGDPVNLKINSDAINLSSSELSSAKKAVVPVINDSTKEIENITFSKTDSVFGTQIQTQKVKDTINYDVLFLILLFGVTMFASQKVMTSMSSNTTMDPAQKAMQDQMGKIMPIMITGTFIFFPIPAGVLLYMIVSNIIQVIQSVVVNKQIEMEDTAKPKTVVNKVPSDAVKIEGKEKSKDEALVEQPSAITDKKKKDKKGKW